MRNHNSRDFGPRDIVVYSDIDGTLLSSTNEVSEEAIHEIERFIAAGFGFSLATGRSLGGVRRILSQIPVNTPLVLCNGAYVFDPVTGLARWNAMHGQLVTNLVKALTNVKDVGIYLECADTSLWVSDHELLQETFIRKENLRPQVFRTVAEVIAKSDIVKMGIKMLAPSISNRSRLTQIMNGLELKFRGRFTWCFSSESYLEIASYHVNKWSGILESQQMRGCKDRVICTIGDSYNDVEMIRNADIGIAVENAADEVKQAASRTVQSAADGALARLLAELRESRTERPQILL